MQRGGGRRPALACLLVAAVVAGCGSSPPPKVAPPQNANSLAAPPAHPPADFTSLAALKQALRGVARCTDVGGATAQCGLLTSPDQPFLVLVFANDAAKSSYLANVHKVDLQAQSRDVKPNGALVGKSWAAVPKVANPGLLPLLARYLGGKQFV